MNTLIKACANAGDLEAAEKWSRYLAKMGIQQNAKGFGKLMEDRDVDWLSCEGKATPAAENSIPNWSLFRKCQEVAVCTFNL